MAMGSIAATAPQIDLAEIDWRRAANWALEAVSRADLTGLVSRMSERQLAIFERLVSSMEVDASLSYAVAQQSEHAALTRAIEAKNAGIAGALAAIKREQRKRTLGSSQRG